MKKVSGFIRDVPGGTPLLNIPVTVYDDIGGGIINAGGMAMGSTNPISTDGSTGYFEWTCELDPGPIRIDANIGVGQHKVRSSREQMPAYGIYISDNPQAFKQFTNGVQAAFTNTFTTTNVNKVLTIQTGGAVMGGYWFQTLTNRTITVPDNVTLATRQDLLVLRQHVGGTYQGKQEIALVTGTVNAVDPTINSDPNILEVPIYRSSLVNGGSTVTLTDLRTYSSISIANNTLGLAKLTTAGVFSTAATAQVLKAPTSGNTPVTASMSIAELSDVTGPFVTNHILTFDGTNFVDTVHDHSATFAAIAHNHDASYSLLGHTHGTIYYTKAEVDAAIAAAMGASGTTIEVQQNDVSKGTGFKRLDFHPAFTVLAEESNQEARINPIFDVLAATFAEGNHTHNYAATSHTHAQPQSRADWAIKSNTGTAVNASGQLMTSFTFALNASTTYDIVGMAFGLVGMNTGNVGEIYVGVKLGGQAINYGSHVGTENGERTSVAFSKMIAQTGGNIAVEMWCQTSSNNGTCGSGGVIAMAWPRDV